MEKIGYFISELPALLLMIGFAAGVIQYRRRRKRQPVYSARDRALFFPPAKVDLRTPATRLKLARCVLLSTAATSVEYLLLAQFGAAILSVALTITTAGILHGLLFDGA